MLINALAALPDEVVLVLDDFHVIREQACLEQIASFLVHLPATVQLVVITRATPALPLARLRAAGDLVEIGMRELRFAGARRGRVPARGSAAPSWAKPDLDQIVQRTEGWPAGLYLAALSLRNHPSPASFVRDFTGDNRFIVDFLAEEVLSRQPPEIRQFLARTSVLGRFCAPLCAAVTGAADAAGIIEVLERENLFVVPLDETRRWFRYHHLFAQVLHAELVRTEAGLIPELHRRAGAWHRAAGSVGEAVQHALAGADPAEAIDLIARHWYAYIGVGRAGTVRDWLRSLSDDQIAASPLAAHCAAWAAALTGEPEPVRRWLPVIEAAPARRHAAGRHPVDGLVGRAAPRGLRVRRAEHHAAVGRRGGRPGR